MSEKTGLILLGIIFVILGMTTGIVSATSLGSLPQTLYVDDLDDGPGNNYTSIQAAVDNSSSGDTILVYPGNYSENVYVNVNKPNINIQSVSRNPVDTAISSNSSSVVYIYANNVTIRGFTIKMGINYGISLKDVSGTKIINNILTDNYYGIYLDNSNNNTLNDNSIRDNGADGINLYHSNNNTMNGNNITNNYNGIGMSDSNNNKLNGNTIKANKCYGLPISGSNNTLNCNNVTDNYYGISLSGSSNTLTDNSVTYNNDSGIYLSGSSNTLADNSVTNNDYDGISLSGSSNTLTGNSVTNNTYRGISLFGSNNSTLTGNNVTDNYYGIYLYNSNNSALIDSSVTGNDIYGIYLYNSSNNTLTCNNVEDNDDYGICLENSNNNILTDNNVTDNVDNGVLLSGSNNNILTDNSVTNNVDDGVLLSGSSNNTLTGNNVEDNDDYGICLDNSNNNTLNDNIISNNSDIGLYMETSRYNNLENNLMNNNSYNFGVEEDYCGLNIEDAFANNISITNLVDGKPVYYLVGNTSGIEINSSSNAGVVYLINCENVLVEGLHLENNNHGLFVYNSTDILVLENNASNNIYGMILSSSGGNTLSENTVLGNIKSGILIANSEDSILTGNIASANGREVSLVSASAEKVLVTENGSEELSLDSELISSDGKKAPVGASASYHIPAGIGLINSPACILTENVARNYNYGIYLKTSHDSNLMNNTAQNNNYYGIFLMESSDSNLTENIARNNSYSGICQVMSGSSSLTGNIALNNSKGINLDSSSGSTLTENIVRNNSYGIYLKMSDNSNLTGNSALKNDYGIYTEYSNYCNLTENNGSNNEICGISLRRSYYCNLTENNGSNNEECGICLQESEYCNLTENNALNNIYVDDPEYFHICVENSGIYLENSNYCNLIENNARNNSYGICLFMSGGSILTGNTVSSNKNPSLPIRGLEVDPAGIFLLGSIHNQLINNEASNNCVGINLFYSSKITLSENVILANDLSGVLLKDSGDNEIFNNKFNNRNNTIFEGGTVGIIWNTTKTTGINIVGGPCLGGNYWGTPNGTGWSQNCTDVDGDGFCDTPYNITDTFTDYLPLKEIPGSDNENESGSSGGSSHTPHYIPVSSKSAGVQTVEDGQQKARAGQETHIDLKGADSGVLGVSFTSEKYSGIVVAMVEVLDEKAAVSEIEDEIREVGEEIDASGSAKIPKGIIFRYMNIKVGNERFENSENLDRGVVTFKVPKTWIKENRIDESTIALNRFHDGKWNRLSSEKTGEDEEFVYFKAETPGFSLYSITGDNLRTEVSNISENTEKSSAPAPETRTEDKQEKSESAPGFGVLLAGIGLLLSVMSVRKNRPE